MVRRLCFAALASVLVLSSGCRLDYLFHAASGQYRLLRDSVSVEEALQSRSLTPEEKQRLRLVAQVKEYGLTRLGLDETDSYQTVYLESSLRPLYVVTACPKDRLSLKTWWFPIVGSVPYLAFFDHGRALSELEELRGKDLDVHLGMAEAYSTLGWFQDPVTRNLLTGTTLDLVDTILHEMTHTTFYVKGQGAFNEGLATLVGRVGAARFLADVYGERSLPAVEARSTLEDQRLFCRFLNRHLRALEELYDSEASYPRKKALRKERFHLMGREFEQLRAHFQTRRFNGFGSDEVNNAYLMSVALYHRSFLTFEAVLEHHRGSIKETIAFFRDLNSSNGEELLAAASDRLKP